MSNMSYFGRVQRDDGRAIVRLRDDAPAWVQEAVRAAHEGELPNDWRYAKCADIFNLYAEGAFDVADEDSLFDLADSLTDIYTVELSEWLVNRFDLVDEYVDDYGLPESFDLASLVRAAQCATIERMAQIIREAILDNVGGA